MKIFDVRLKSEMYLSDHISTYVHLVTSAEMEKTANNY